MTNRTSQPVVDKHKLGGGSLTGSPVLSSWRTLSQVYPLLVKMHQHGPYNNLIDCKVVDFIGIPLLCVTRMGTTCYNDLQRHNQGSYQESRSSIVIDHKVKFQKNIGFVTHDTRLSYSPMSPMVDTSHKGAYLDLVERVVCSGVPNYVGVRAPLPSVFNFDYLYEHIQDYHDKALIDYLQFGFPLGINPGSHIGNNATDNHQSAKEWSGQVQQFIDDELAHGALLGPFDEVPHPQFTWAPLMTRPKGQGRRVILDLSFGEFSVNKATIKDNLLNLPGLDNLISSLRDLGRSARVFKVNISRAFRNIPVDPADSIHLGIKWDNQFYIDKHLAFGAVHGTAIFERVSNFIRFIMAKHGFQVWNYIDDIYACCHVDVAREAFDTLLEVIRNVGLPINYSKVFSPVSRLPIMGIVVDTDEATFSIESAKLNEILILCYTSLLRRRFTKHEFQSLLGKLLYISRCVRGARVFLNRILAVLHAHHNSRYICPDEGFYHDILWFINFVKQFNGVVAFNNVTVAHEVFVDATLTGIGGIWGLRAYSALVPPNLAHRISITQVEMYNLLVAVCLWAPLWKNKTIRIRCDNESAVMVCNTGKTRDPFLSWCIRQLWFICAQHNVNAQVRHIQGKQNVAADALSRYKFQGTSHTIWEDVSSVLPL